MERRAYKRVKVHLPASIDGPFAGSKMVTVMDMNPEGLSFGSKEPVEAGKTVVLIMALGEDTVHLNLMVEWSEDGPGEYRIGARLAATPMEEYIKFIRFYSGKFLAQLMQRKTILIVDDEKDMVALLKIELESRNFNVITAYDGEEAFDQYSHEHPDLIILDLMMPRLNGLGVCRKIRRENKDYKTPIVMLTGLKEDTDRIVGRVLGSDRYIVKPFEIEQLLQEIDELLVAAA